jgi:hypothetical protein
MDYEIKKAIKSDNVAYLIDRYISPDMLILAFQRKSRDCVIHILSSYEVNVRNVPNIMDLFADYCRGNADFNDDILPVIRLIEAKFTITELNRLLNKRGRSIQSPIVSIANGDFEIFKYFVDNYQIYAHNFKIICLSNDNFTRHRDYLINSRLRHDLEYKVLNYVQL